MEISIRSLSEELYSAISQKLCINSLTHLVSEGERLNRKYDVLEFYSEINPRSD